MPKSLGVIDRLHQGVAQLQQEGFFQTGGPNPPLPLSFRCRYLSGAAIFPVNMVRLICLISRCMK